MILILGYGNPLRSDDALGQRVAQALRQRLKGGDFQVQTAYQLTPELVDLRQPGASGDFHRRANGRRAGRSDPRNRCCSAGDGRIHAQRHACLAVERGA